MINHQSLFDALAGGPLASWIEPLRRTLVDAFDPLRNRNLSPWLAAFAAAPSLTTQTWRFDTNVVTIGRANDCNAADIDRLTLTLRELCPWRKGPFEVFGTYIDTEWRSDLKWSRLAPHISPLLGRQVLDVGCGSGYHCWRMLGEGARWVLGVEPSLLFNLQFHIIKRFVPHAAADMLPITLEALPKARPCFDTVFSMGVLYHRRSPIDHLLSLKSLLRAGGELVLETLVVDNMDVLCPLERYAKMRNVWFIPSCALLTTWLQRCGFEGIRVVDVNCTSQSEQRRTAWMNGESLREFLDQNDINRTVEGYPAPKRAIVIASLPNP